MRYKKFEFEVYTVEDFEKEVSFLPLPYNYKDLYSVSLERYGYLHDVGYTCVLTPSNNPTGWDTFEINLKKAYDDMLACAEMAANFAYH